jgi:hypothetical protein
MQPAPDRAAALAALDAARRDALLAAVQDVPEHGRPLEVALSRPGVPWVRHGPYWLSGLRTAMKQAWDSGATQRFKRLALHAHRSNRELVDEHVGPALFWLSHLPWVRPVADFHDWHHDADEVLARLTRHLVVEHPVPTWLLAEAWEQEQPRRALLLHMTRGGSLRSVVGTALMPAPLTRRMQHLLMTETECHDRDWAVRTAQWEALGGSEDRGWWVRHTVWGQDLGDPATEALRLRQIGWLARQDGEFDVHRVASYLDVERLDPTGRSLARIADEAARWQQAMGPAVRTIARKGPQPEVRPAPWPALALERTVDGEAQRWTTQQLRTRRALFWEGQRLRHCVATYWNCIAVRRRSIWSVRCNNKRVLTVEVDDAAGTMRQISGFANRTFTRDEEQVLRAWTRAGGPQLGSAPATA